MPGRSLWQRTSFRALKRVITRRACSLRADICCDIFGFWNIDLTFWSNPRQGAANLQVASDAKSPDRRTQAGSGPVCDALEARPLTPGNERFALSQRSHSFPGLPGRANLPACRTQLLAAG